MSKLPDTKVRVEAVPTEACSSFAFREFRGPRFPFNWNVVCRPLPRCVTWCAIPGTTTREIRDIRCVV